MDVEILDKDGNLVPDADNQLTFKIKGPGALVGTDAGDPTSLIPFNSEVLPAFHGRAAAVVKAGGAGIVQVTVSSGDLKKSVVKKNVFR